MKQPKQRILRWMWCLLLLVLPHVFAHAQAGSQGAIAVTVADASGGQIPQANLVLVEKATNYSHEAVTSDKGTYTFVNLDIGEYKLSVTKSGYATTLLESATPEGS